MSCTLYDILTFTFTLYLACIIHDLTFITCTTIFFGEGSKKWEGPYNFKIFGLGRGPPEYYGALDFYDTGPLWPRAPINNEFNDNLIK